MQCTQILCACVYDTISGVVYLICVGPFAVNHVFCVHMCMHAPECLLAH